MFASDPQKFRNALPSLKMINPLVFAYMSSHMYAIITATHIAYENINSSYIRRLCVHVIRSIQNFTYNILCVRTNFYISTPFICWKALVCICCWTFHCHTPPLPLCIGSLTTPLHARLTLARTRISHILAWHSTRRTFAKKKPLS